MSLGIKVKELRKARGWSQDEIAKKAKLSRSYISDIERNKERKPTADKIIKLANAFNIEPEELYEAAGYLTPESRKKRVESPEDILSRLRLAMPVAIPVYTDYYVHAGAPVEPIEYVYRTQAKPANKAVEGYIVRGTCLEPDIREGDIIIIQRDGQIDGGDIIACVIGEQMHLGRLRKIADSLYLENRHRSYKFEECHLAAPVIEVIRRLK